MRAIRLAVCPGLASLAALCAARAQSVSVNATITGEVLPGSRLPADHHDHGHHDDDRGDHDHGQHDD